MTNTKPEIHLFLIWSKAYNKRKEILKDLAAHFQIRFVQEIIWSDDLFANNLTQFYGTKLPPNSFKEKHCGTGPFTVIIVGDEKPEYANRKTTKGFKKVNVKTFDLKVKYRDWTGGGHKIHATNTTQETEHDIMLLIGKSAEMFAGKNLTWDGKINTIETDLIGAKGWKNFNEFFKVLNVTTTYVVLRNFDEITTNGVNGDIDILTDSAMDLAFITNAKKIHKSIRRPAYLVRIGNQFIRFDFRQIGDNYFNKQWQSETLKNKILSSSGFYIPNEVDHFYTLLYHALIHKSELNPAYHEKLLKMGQDLNVIYSNSNVYIAEWLQILEKYMQKKNYLITLPKDYSVYKNCISNIKTESDVFTLLVRKIWTRLTKLKNAITNK